MDGLFFLGAIAGIVLLMLWVAQNDKVGIDEPTRGLFAMREAAGEADAKQGKASGRSAGRPVAGPTGRGQVQADPARRPDAVR